MQRRGTSRKKKIITFYNDHLLGKIFILVEENIEELNSDQVWGTDPHVSTFSFFVPIRPWLLSIVQLVCGR